MSCLQCIRISVCGEGSLASRWQLTGRISVSPSSSILKTVMICVTFVSEGLTTSLEPTTRVGTTLSLQLKSQRMHGFRFHSIALSLLQGSCSGSWECSSRLPYVPLAQAELRAIVSMHAGLRAGTEEDDEANHQTLLLAQKYTSGSVVYTDHAAMRMDAIGCLPLST